MNKNNTDIRQKVNSILDMHLISSFYEEIQQLQDKYHITNEELTCMFPTPPRRDVIPASILSDDRLSSFEAIVKYLKENCSMNFKDIGELLNRSKFTIASSYRTAKAKTYKVFVMPISKYAIPTECIAHRKYSVLESIVLYLKNTYKLKFCEIAHILNLNQRTIWTVYKRVQEKMRKHYR